MKLVRYEGMVSVTDVVGALDGYLSGAEVRFKAEMRGTEEAVVSEKGLVEVRFKLEDMNKFSWMLGRAETRWTEWTKVRMSEGTVTAFVDGSLATGEVRMELSEERVAMAVSGRVDVGSFLARFLVRGVAFVGKAYLKYEGDTEVPAEGVVSLVGVLI